MLILPKGMQEPIKNEFWETSGRTPNEDYNEDRIYTNIVNDYCRLNHIPGKKNWFEVRLMEQKTSIKFLAPWWEDAVWAEKIFWVFQRPLQLYPEGTVPYPVYHIEPHEAMRIDQHYFTKNGMHISQEYQALILPVELTQIAWNETSAGTSDHKRFRPEYNPDDMELEKVEKNRDKIDKIKEQISEIADNVIKESGHEIR